MKPASFEYLAPRSAGEALELLAEYGSDAKVLAGGQSLIPLMNMRLVKPRLLIDINRCGELAYVEEGERYVRIGALTRHYDAETSMVVREHCPLLADAIGHIGHLPIRYRGTVGGSVAHADPAAEIPTVLTCLGGVVLARSRSKESVYTADEFFLGYLNTVLQADQMVVEIAFPKMGPRDGWAFVELTRRRGDFALVSVACRLRLDEGGRRIEEVNLGLGGVGAAPIRPRKAESLLSGEEPTEVLLREISLVAAEESDPQSDYHASAEYRRAMVQVLVEIALREAAARAREGIGNDC